MMDIVLFLCIICCVCLWIATKKGIFVIAGVFFFGLGLMVISNCISIEINQLVRHKVLVSDFLSVFVLKLIGSVSVSDTRIISLAGELIILLSFLALAMQLFPKNKLLWLLFIPIAVYCFINLPDTKYNLYLMRIDEKKVRELYALNSAVIIFYFVMPYALAFYRRLTTIMIPTKKKFFAVNSLIIVSELVFLVLMACNNINDIFFYSTDIFYRKGDVYIGVQYYLLFSLAAAMAIITALDFARVNRYIGSSGPELFDSSPELEKTLRGVLHTYKNFFFAIRMNSMLLMNKAKASGEEVDKSVTEIYNITDNALFTLTMQLDKLGRIGALNDERVNITEMLDYSVEKAVVPENIEVKVNFMSDVKTLFCDMFLMTELFSNLIKNAVSAVGTAGEPKIEINILSEKEWVLIEVCDNGCGIDRKNLKSIFKPLVSIRNGLNDWGIGLFYANKIVSTFKGCLYAVSYPNQMTKFQVYLPKY